MPSAVSTLMLSLLFLYDDLPSAIELVHDGTPLEHSKLLRLLLIESGQLRWICLALTPWHVNSLHW